MDASLLSALSALVGAVIGGLASFFASFFAQREQARARWIDQDRTRRQEVYKDFIEEASKCYADALQHDEADVPELVGLFATIGRMRVLSSRKVLAIAEELGRKILDIYRQPTKAFPSYWRWQTTSRSISCAISLKRVAKNSKPCGLSNCRMVAMQPAEN